MKIFLGGTCNESKWRKDLISLLDTKIEYFDPVVKNWNEEAKQEELRQRQICDYILYVITPKMTGVYSIAEVVDDSNKRPDKTLFCVLKEDEDKFFDEGQMRSLESVSEMVQANGVRVFHKLENVAQWLNALLPKNFYNISDFKDINVFNENFRIMKKLLKDKKV